MLGRYKEFIVSAGDEDVRRFKTMMFIMHILMIANILYFLFFTNYYYQSIPFTTIAWFVLHRVFVSAFARPDGLSTLLKKAVQKRFPDHCEEIKVIRTSTLSFIIDYRGTELIEKDVVKEFKYIETIMGLYIENSITDPPGYCKINFSREKPFKTEFAPIDFGRMVKINY